MPFSEARKICLDYTVNGMETITKLPRSSTGSFRFLYTSGSNAVRDPKDKPWVLGDFCVLRVLSLSLSFIPSHTGTEYVLQGECENQVINYANASKGTVQACISKPGLIDAPGKTGPVMSVVQTIGRSIIGLPKVQVTEIAATLIDQAVNGIEKETLLNDDLIRIGQKALASAEKSNGE